MSQILLYNLFQLLDGSGLKKNVVDNEITHEDYLKCLETKAGQLRKMVILRSDMHDIYTEEVNKIALSADDDKRIIMKDGIFTLAYGHYKSAVEKAENQQKYM